MDALAEFVEALEQLDHAYSSNRLKHYEPYEFQRNFHNAQGFETNLPAQQRFLMAGNGTGKSVAGAFEVAMHATGRYPDWYKGTRVPYPTEIIVGAKTNDAAVKVVQKALFGEIMDKRSLGTGTIPKDCLNKNFKMKPGIPGAVGEALVKHITGKWSKISIMSYDQKAKAFMGTRFDVGWLDEEPPQEIWSQFIRGTISRKNAILFITATPEEGMTPIVIQFMNDLKPGQAIVTATWDDAPHLSEEEKIQRLAAFPPHEREMRSRGVPLMGTGLIFPFTPEDLLVKPFEIPDHWPQIVGIDFGLNHPFAAAKLAWDRDTDTVYLTAEHRVSNHVPTQHADVIKKWGAWPVSWPHDGLNREKGTGDELRQAYIDAGLDMLPQKATNPPQMGQKEGEGGNSREAAILALYNRMEDGKFKVFETCRKFEEERRMYHRDQNGKIVDIMDDLMSAVRYAHMMLRHARTKTVRIKKPVIAAGYANW